MNGRPQFDISRTDADSARRGLSDSDRLKALARSQLMDAETEPVFDGAVRLASSVLGVRVSLLSLVDEERQFFKAQTGLTGRVAEERQTPLSHSFCQHVVADAAPLRVTDARTDPRVKGNLAIEDLSVIAYLGVPVRAPGGEVLGALCAISDAPRDWSADDLEHLSGIARGVESEIALRSALADSQAQSDLLQHVIDALPIGIAIAQVPTAALAWVNQWGREVLNDDLDAEDAHDYRALGAQHQDGSRYGADEYPLVRSATGGETIVAEPMVYRRRDGRVVELEVSSDRMPGDDRFAIASFVDVTGRKQAEAEAEKARWQLVRVLEGTVDPILVMDRLWKVTYANAAAREILPGAKEIVGRDIWEAFPDWVEGPIWHAYQDAVRQGVPGTADLHIDEKDLHYEARAFPTGQDLIVFFRDVTAERRAIETRQLLVRELNHRVKNLFAVVSSMVGMTARHTRTPAEMAKGLRGRIGALAKAHDLIRPAVTEDELSQSDVSLQTLVASLIEPHLLHKREWIGIDGPAIMLSAVGTTSLSLVLHEFATNAAKYGALSEPDGHLEVVWRIEDPDLKLVWTESGGPALSGVPKKMGFGSTLVKMSVTGQLHGSVETEWRPEGLRATLRMPLAVLQA